MIEAKFVFIGAGGGSLSLLERSGIPESKGYGGFPVSGQWLRCTNPSIIEQHHAKVYGKAAFGCISDVGAAFTRFIDGQKHWTVRWLYHQVSKGVPWDLFQSSALTILCPWSVRGLET